MELFENTRKHAILRRTRMQLGIVIFFWLIENPILRNAYNWKNKSRDKNLGIN